MNICYFKKLIIFALLFFLFYSAKSSSAQTPAADSAVADGEATLGVARMVEVSEKNVKDGSILSAGKKGAVLTVIPYDSQVLGIVSRDAAIILNNTNGDNAVPVISTGTVYILVSSRDGEIKKGDLLTSSTIKGVAVKATKDGFVLGSAMENYSNPKKNESGIIAASLDLHYFNSKPVFPGSLSDVFKLVLLPTKEGPGPLFKYIMAALVVLGSMVLGFFSFGRAAAKGVEALGRNPSASRIIHLGIVFNVTITVAIALAGLIVAFLILRL
ncbi:MAG: hypothetical protein Q7T54_05205 [Candidatus Levybacteria bacterium]|nr:hypothetical protein [Candidatus Levybacteria bacterium]